MAFGAELKDFVAGFKAGSDVVNDSEDRKDRREDRKLREEWLTKNYDHQLSREANEDAFREWTKDHMQRREGVEDEYKAEDRVRQKRESDARVDYWNHGGSRTGNRAVYTGEEFVPPDPNADPDADVPTQDESATPPTPSDPADTSAGPQSSNVTDHPDQQLAYAPSSGDTARSGTASGALDKLASGGQQAIPSGYTEGQPWLVYANNGATRNKPISGKLESALSQVAPDMGLTVKVFSGGQDSSGPNRTGSHRHDQGNAADVFLYASDGHKLDWKNPKDIPVYKEFVEKAKKAGLTGFGAGDGYMQEGSMHVGYGTPAVWGAGGKGQNAAPWLVSAYNGGYSTGGLVGAIDDGEDKQSPDTSGMITVALADEPEQAPEQAPQQVVPQAIPDGNSAPTPTPRPDYEGTDTSEKEPPTKDPYELGRRSVREGLKQALKDAGVTNPAAIDDPQSDNAHRNYLMGYGKAPHDIVKEALSAVDPKKKMSVGERNMAALGSVYNFYMTQGKPQQAKAAAASMVQYYRSEANRYLALSQAAAQSGNLDAAAQAAVAAYTNIPNGRDLKIKKLKNGYEISVTDQDSGKQVTKQVVDPTQFAAAAMHFNPGTFDQEILNAAGQKAPKHADVTPNQLGEMGSNLDSVLTDMPELADIAKDKQAMSDVRNTALAIARHGSFDPKQSAEIARSMIFDGDASKPSFKVEKEFGNPDYVTITTADGNSFPMTRNDFATVSKAMERNMAAKGKEEGETKAKEERSATATKEKGLADEAAKKAMDAFESKYQGLSQNPNVGIGAIPDDPQAPPPQPQPQGPPQPAPDHAAEQDAFDKKYPELNQNTNAGVGASPQPMDGVAPQNKKTVQQMLDKRDQLANANDPVSRNAIRIINQRLAQLGYRE